MKADVDPIYLRYLAIVSQTRLAGVIRRWRLQGASRTSGKENLVVKMQQRLVAKNR